jgi:16S rRNA (uracil1498-N3)-methyltransferase
VLPADEAHHLRHVLRLHAGDDVALFDGAGHEWRARVASVSRRGEVVCELTQAIVPVPEPPVDVTLAVGALKADQLDGVVRDATMLGVARIVPVVTDRLALPRRALRSDLVRARWQRIAVGSAKQCGRAVVPVVTAPVPFNEALRSAEEATVLMCVEPSARRDAADVRTLSRPVRALAMVGPEGGWSPAEIELASRGNAQFLHLGVRTLRAETAPTVLLAALWTVWGW